MAPTIQQSRPRESSRGPNLVPFERGRIAQASKDGRTLEDIAEPFPRAPPIISHTINNAPRHNKAPQNLPACEPGPDTESAFSSVHPPQYSASRLHRDKKTVRSIEELQDREMRPSERSTRCKAPERPQTTSEPHGIRVSKTQKASIQLSPKTSSLAGRGGRYIHRGFVRHPTKSYNSDSEKGWTTGLDSSEVSHGGTRQEHQNSPLPPSALIARHRKHSQAAAKPGETVKGQVRMGSSSHAQAPLLYPPTPVRFKPQHDIR
jgi:hypothetical protein